MSAARTDRGSAPGSADGSAGASTHAHSTTYASNPLTALREGRLTRRFVQLYAGLVLYGFSMTLMVESTLGLDPWDVLHQGIALRTPMSIGVVVVVMSFVVLLAWIPLKQWPGIGTISNAIVIGLTMDLTIWLMPTPKSIVVRIVFLLAAVVLNAIATAAYIGARFGPGPRDGLMTGLVRRTGKSIRLIRTVIEVTVLVAGWLLGGTVGIGTLLYAFGIGPLAQIFLPRLTIPPSGTAMPEAARSGAAPAPEGGPASVGDHEQ